MSMGPEVWRSDGQVCGCGQPAAYTVYYPGWWQGKRLQHLCQGCKDELGQEIRDE